MKKRTVIIFIIIAAVMLISSCGTGAAPKQTPGPTSPQTPVSTAADPPAAETAVTEPAGDKVIRVWTYTTEVPYMIEKYIESHPDFGYTMEMTMPEVLEISLDETFTDGNADGPDIYCAESAFVIKYTQGTMSDHAMPYEKLGIDVGAKIKAAGTPGYVVDIGTRPSDNAVVGLGYQATGGAFIYRRSIAKKVWGTDDPAAIADKIGPGWEKFFAAAGELKGKGYAMVSGIGDIWHSIENSADKGWISAGKLYIDPKREAYLDRAKKLIDEGYSNDTSDWTEEWYADMADAGPKPVFGFFGPAWMINYVLAGHCSTGYYDNDEWIETGSTFGDWAVCEPTESFFWGGTWVIANKELEKDPAKMAAVAELIEWITLDCTEDGLQYAWARGDLEFLRGVKDTVTSRTAMEMSEGALPFLGGQDMYGVYMQAGEEANGKNVTEYDQIISMIWREQVSKYAHGECTREEAIAAFKQKVKEQLGIDAW